MLPALTVTATAIDLTVGTATLITVTVVAADTTQQKYTVTVTRAASDDATLSGPWTLTGAVLVEVVAAETTEYTSAVATDVEQISIAATANNSEAEVAYSPADAVPDDDDDQTELHDAGHQVDLDEGENLITVTVTAGDGSTQDLHRHGYPCGACRVGRRDAGSALSLSGGLTLAPVFDAQTMAYTASAPFDLDTRRGRCPEPGHRHGDGGRPAVLRPALRRLTPTATPKRLVIRFP